MPYCKCWHPMVWTILELRITLPMIHLSSTIFIFFLRIDAGKHQHISIYGGYYIFQLDYPPGSFKCIPMRYTPSLPITIVNFTKFWDLLKCICSKFMSYLHSMKQFMCVWKNTDGSFKFWTLFKLQILNLSIEQYYTPEFCPCVSWDSPTVQVRWICNHHWLQA